MKIVELHAENFKRLKAVTITPDGFVQVIGGRNAQGKTSVLDCILAGLAGASGAKAITMPIREGETEATVRLDMGDIVVTRTWKDGKSTLKVESALGASFTSPQKVLDEMLGRLSFDPLEFTRLTPKQQVNALLDMVELEIDLEKNDSDRAIAYDERTVNGRKLKEAEGALSALGRVEIAPQELVSVSHLLAQYEEALDIEKKALMYAERRLFLRNEQERIETELEQIRVWFDGKPEVTGSMIIKHELDNAEETNNQVRRNMNRDGYRKIVAELEGAVKSCTSRIEALDKAKADALATAKFPIEGLGFTEDGVTFNGIPFTDCSSSEQIRVSLAMATALNPEIRVIRILDGSLLDSDAMKLITEWAHEKDFQVWVERVGDADGVGVIIEDGEVK